MSDTSRYTRLSVFKTLAKIVGITLVLGGVAAFGGGKYAESFIASQLGEQEITMPDASSIDAQVKAGRLTTEDADALRPYAGKQMTTGPQAEAYADHFVLAHMYAAGKGVGLDRATFATVGKAAEEAQGEATEQVKADHPKATEKELKALVAKEMKNPETPYPAAARAGQLDAMRTNVFLNGSTIRGMLLNAYGWSVIGTIARYAGIAAGLLGLALGIWGFLPVKREDAKPSATRYSKN